MLVRVGRAIGFMGFLLTLSIVLPFVRHPQGLRAETLAPNSDDEIVYFDGDHVIRIYDPKPTSSVLQVAWASPEGGWGNIALGDVTGDGDLEIVAIRQQGDGGRLTIFDPVAQDSPLDQTQDNDGVPWATLYDLLLPRPPRLLAVGEFDPNRPGREIIYSYAEDDEFDRFVILRSADEGLPGREWEEQRTWTLEGRWSAIATGNMYVVDAIDEVGLVSTARGELAVYRVEPAVVQTFNNVNVEHRWNNLAFGQYVIVNNDGDEVGAVRDADLPLASTWVFRLNESAVVDVLGERLSPSPNVVFFADVRGNGDDELLVLRQVRPELGPRPRLVLRDGNNNDNPVLREDLLDGDNEYKGGDGGDIDGDGRDEIVVIRNNRIRIYPEPESSVTYQLIERFTNGLTVKLGNVDAAGLAQGPRLFASRSQVEATLQPGQTSGATHIRLQDATKGSALPFTLDVQGADEWVNVTQTSTTTPATVTVTLDAKDVQPGEYSGRIVVDVTTSGVQNEPLVINLRLRVGSVVEANPTSVEFVYYPCQEPLSPREQSIQLSASDEVSYTAQIDGNPDWLTVSPEAGVLPETVTVSVDPSLRPADIVRADLLVTIDLPGLPGIVNRVPIFLTCPANRNYLPRISD